MHRIAKLEVVSHASREISLTSVVSRSLTFATVVITAEDTRPRPTAPTPNDAQ
jgi:hypothetical protein